MVKITDSKIAQALNSSLMIFIKYLMLIQKYHIKKVS